METACKLEKEYSASGLPTAIADENMNILWKNGAAEAEVFGENADVIFGGKPRAGLLTRKINGVFYSFNVIKTSDGENGRFFYIIELVSPRGDGFAEEAAREYISHICAEVRSAANKITNLADRILYGLSENSSRRRTEENVDKLYEAAENLEREAVFPEKLYSAINGGEENIIILDMEMSAVVSGIKSMLGGVKVSEDYDRDIFFRMNADAFEAAVAAMTAEHCGKFPNAERVIFSARRFGRDRAEIAIMVLNTDCKPSRPERVFGKQLFSEYIYSMLERKNGVIFSQENFRGGFVSKMNIEVLPRGNTVFAEKPVDGSGRRRGIIEKLAFFFGKNSAAESGGFDKNEPERVHNIYREDIENEETKI